MKHPWWQRLLHAFGVHFWEYWMDDFEHHYRSCLICDYEEIKINGLWLTCYRKVNRGIKGPGRYGLTNDEPCNDPTT